LGAEPDGKLGLARGANIDRVLWSPFELATVAGGGRYEGFGNSDDFSPLRNRGAKALTNFGKDFQANGNKLKKQ
jgi:hypothetical protein